MQQYLLSLSEQLCGIDSLLFACVQQAFNQNKHGYACVEVIYQPLFALANTLWGRRNGILFRSFNTTFDTIEILLKKDSQLSLHKKGKQKDMWKSSKLNR